MGNAPAPSMCSKFRQRDFASCSNKESIAKSDACSSASDFTQKKLTRVRLGNLILHDLPRGKWRPLSVQEVGVISSKTASSTRAERSRRGNLKVARLDSSSFARSDDDSG